MGLGLKGKLIASFLGVSLFISAAAVAGILVAGRTMESTSEAISSHQIPLLNRASNAVVDLYRVRVQTGYYLAEFDPRLREPIHKKIQELWGLLDQDMNSLAQSIKGVEPMLGHDDGASLERLFNRSRENAAKLKKHLGEQFSLHETQCNLVFRYSSDASYQPIHAFLNRVVLDHINWMRQLEWSVENNKKFEGQMDPTQCRYGNWYYSYDIRDKRLKAILAEGEKLHEQLHQTGRLSDQAISGGRVLEAAEDLGRAKEISDKLVKILEDAQFYALERFNRLEQLEGQAGAKALATARAFAADMLRIKELAGRFIDQGMDQARQTIRASVLVMLGALLASLLAALVFSWRFSARLLEVVDAVRRGLRAMANGDLVHRVPDKALKRADEIGEMARDARQAGTNLSTTVREIALAANNVATSAAEISRGNQDLSTRTQQQAGAIEQTASALEQMTSTVKANADSARQANDLAKASSDMAQEGGRVVGRTIEAMAEVTSSSKKISDIITVVNEIAFQTNLLALNAAVEAARAGQAGRGFAVVAGEVRSLAQRSAAAAKEIQGLISDSVTKVSQGNALVAQSGRLLGDIIANVQAVADTMAEITAGSQEQAQGIEEVNKAVSQMDVTVQHNAALVEESAGAAENMAAAAEELRSQVAQFKVDSRGAAPAVLPAPAPRPAPPKPAASKPAASRPAAAAPARKPAAPAKGADDFFASADLDGFEEF